MISIIRAGYSPDSISGSRIIDALRNEFSEVPPEATCIRRLIVIRKIDPEDFEDEGVDDMSHKFKDDEDLDISPEDLDAIDKEVPAEVDKMPDTDLDDEDLDGDLDDIPTGDGEEVSEDNLDSVEQEIPPEVDKMSMDDLGLTEDDLDDLESGDYEDQDMDALEMSEEELAALEKEIPPEVDKIKDTDLDIDPDLEEDDAPVEESVIEKVADTKGGMDDYI